MKNKLSHLTYLCAAGYLLSSCQVRIPSETTPEPSFYGFIDQTKVINGYPFKPESWIVISDRASNSVFLNQDEKSAKEIQFLEPLLVVKRNSNKKLIKVAQYNPDALMQKLPKKSIKTYGWIPEDQLLLWNNSIRSSETGFNLKAALVPNHSDVLNKGDKYIKNDSVLLFASPDLTKTINKKLPVGQLVYIYKKGENNRFLIGKTPSVKVDSIGDNIYGWVNGNMISSWGDRTALMASPEYTYTPENDMGVTKEASSGSPSSTAFLLSDATYRTPVENLISVSPTALSKGNKAKFFGNALDYSNNEVVNVLGEPLKFNRYKEIIRRNKNLNVVFAIDISRDNTQNISIAKSAFQDFQLKLKNLSYYKNIKFGAVLFKNNPCGENVAKSKLSADYEEITKFIEQQSVAMNCNSVTGQPLSEGLDAAGELLSTVPDDTNILVVTGATSATEGGSYNSLRSLTAGRARTLFFQTASASSDVYNNFVLLAENVLTSTARNIAELDKERIVDQSIIFDKNNYNLVHGEEGVYSLDYPKASMSQGFVVYPKKGEASSMSLLTKSLDALVGQVTHYNKTIDSTLTGYFKSKVGAAKTLLKPDFRAQFPDAPAIIPVDISMQLMPYENPFLVRGTFTDEFKEYAPGVQKGILLSESEYDDLRKFYLEIYKETEPYSANFSQSKAINRYLKVLKKFSTDENFSKGKLREKAMDYSVAMSTGFDNSAEDMLNKYMLKGWKKSSVVPEAAAKAYFNQFKMLGDRLLENKNNSKITIQQNGAKFYWLNSYFMPMITPRESL